MTSPLRRLTAVPPGQSRPDRGADLAAKLEVAEAWNKVLRAQMEVLQAQIDAVAEIYGTGPVGRLTRIAKAVAAVEMITVDDLRGPSQVRVVAWPRQQFMLAARASGHSLQDIAAFLNRDHATVVHGIGAAKARQEGRDQDD